MLADVMQHPIYLYENYIYTTVHKTTNFHCSMLLPRKNSLLETCGRRNAIILIKLRPQFLITKKIQFDLLSPNLQSRSTSFKVTYALYRAPYIHLNLHNHRPESLEPILFGCVTYAH